MRLLVKVQFGGGVGGDDVKANLTGSLVGSVQYTCPVVPLCIVDASLSHYVGN